MFRWSSGCRLSISSPSSYCFQGLRVYSSIWRHPSHSYILSLCGYPIQNFNLFFEHLRKNSHSKGWTWLFRMITICTCRFLWTRYSEFYGHRLRVSSRLYRGWRRLRRSRTTSDLLLSSRSSGSLLTAPAAKLSGKLLNWCLFVVGFRKVRVLWHIHPPLSVGRSYRSLGRGIGAEKGVLASTSRPGRLLIQISMPI